MQVCRRDEIYDMAPLVFGIGLPRTGTRSLTKAMELLGFRSKHYFSMAEWHTMVMRKEPQIDFACDLPAPLFIDELAAAFPEARFIYTTRAAETWAPSMRWLLHRNGWRGTSDWPLYRSRLFGDKDQLSHLVHVRENHLARVKNILPARDVLMMDIEAGDGWELLCDWLGLPIPPAPFPFEGRRDA